MSDVRTTFLLPIPGEADHDSHKRRKDSDTISAEFVFVPRNDSNGHDEQLPDHVTLSVTQVRFLVQVMRAFRHQSAKLVPLREQALLCRTQVNYQKVVRKHKEHFVQDSRATLEQAETMYRTTQSAVDDVRRDIARQQLHDDQHVLEQQEEIIRKLETAQSDVEFRMQIRESSLAAAVDDWLRILDQQCWMDDVQTYPEQASESGKSEQSTSSVSVDPLMINYERRVQELEIAEQRMLELEESHGEARVMRNLREDQERACEMSEDAFEAACKDEIHRTKSEFDKVLAAARLAQSACIDNDIDLCAFHQPLPLRLLRHLGVNTDDDHDLDRDVRIPYTKSRDQCSGPTVRLQGFAGEEGESDHSIHFPESESTTTAENVVLTSKVERWIQCTERSFIDQADASGRFDMFSSLSDSAVQGIPTPRPARRHTVGARV